MIPIGLYRRQMVNYNQFKEEEDRFAMTQAQKAA